MNSEKNSLVPIAQVEEKTAQWLVPRYIPKGQITILAGDGGTGKTTIWCNLAAAVSSGKKVFFDEVPEDFTGYQPQKVLFFSSEDSIEYTLRSKLRRAGANLENIKSLPITDNTFRDLKFGSDLLKFLIEQEKPALVVFDPIQAFIPPDIQMGQRNAMRNNLNPLIGLGEEYGTTFLIIVHTNKRQGVYGRNRIADSADVWDIARSVLIAGTTDNSQVRYLSHEKSNYGELGETALFKIEDGIAVFDTYCDKRDADFVRERDALAYQAPQRHDAEDFIFQYLRNGKKPTAELDAAAVASGISKKTLERAKTEMRKKGILGVTRTGYGNNQVWYSCLKIHNVS